MTGQQTAGAAQLLLLGRGRAFEASLFVITLSDDDFFDSQGYY